MPYYRKATITQCHGDCLSCHSNLCSIWCLSVYACMVVLIKANRLACGQLVRYHYGDCSSKEALPSGQHSGNIFTSNIALLLSPGWEQSSSSPWRRCFLPLYWCFNNLHSNVISKLASIVSYGLLCAIKLDSNLSKSSVVWEPVPAKVMCWEKNKRTEITVALQPWILYQLGNNRKRGRGKLGPLFASLGLEVEITCMLCFR